MAQVNFSALRRNSTADTLAKLKQDVAKVTSNGFEKDTRFWNLTADQSGTGSAVIRFLPATSDETLPMVKVLSHSFKNNGKWFIEECPKTIGLPCPACEANEPMWTIDKDTASARKAGTQYIANVYIVKDPAKPENNGKVFLFKFGMKILEKLNKAMAGDEDAGLKAVNPFSFFDGANFSLKVKKVAGFRNYDDSMVVATGDFLDGDEDRLTVVLQSCYDLQEFHDEKKFKSYQDLKSRWAIVVDGATQGGAARTVVEDDHAPASASPAREYAAPAAAPADETPPSSSPQAADDDVAFFQNLAKKQQG